MSTVQQVISSLPALELPELLPVPYTGTSSVGVGLAVESMKRHVSDEGWQLFAGLEWAGYRLKGYAIRADSTTSVTRILSNEPDIGVVVLQDKREWDGSYSNFRDPRARFKFTSYEVLRERPDIFKVTVLKDVHQRPFYYLAHAGEIGCHAWIHYYHPRIVRRLQPYIRPRHLIRTWHSVDSDQVPAYSSKREGCLLSGFRLPRVYPLRERLWVSDTLPNTIRVTHPGYSCGSCYTPAFLQLLSRFKVAICTSSIYGYAIRKIIEATACGCRVITNLPHDDVLPEIDGNLVRIPSTSKPEDVANLLKHLYADYDPAEQEFYANRAKMWYDYRAVGKRLAADIEALRGGYNTT